MTIHIFDFDDTLYNVDKDVLYDDVEIILIYLQARNDTMYIITGNYNIHTLLKKFEITEYFKDVYISNYKEKYIKDIIIQAKLGAELEEEDIYFYDDLYENSTNLVNFKLIKDGLKLTDIL